MSEPFTDRCFYCGSDHVLPDAWWCDSSKCWEAYDAEEDKHMKYEYRTPLTRNKAAVDLSQTRASVWGLHWTIIKNAAEGLARLAKAPVR
jgi:hypothetical protein